MNRKKYHKPGKSLHRIKAAITNHLLPFACCLLPFAFCLSACSREAGNEAGKTTIIVAAASDLQPAFEELGQAFERERNIKVIFNFGSTGNLTRQIENGLPVDLFAAANIAFIERLAKRDLIIPDTKALYARGRITIWRRDDSPHKLERLEDLASPAIKRMAIANPEHAPYGLAAKEALQTVKIWDAVQAKLVFGENVRQATQFTETGNADVAITALSLSLQMSLQNKGRWTLIPEDLHRPLEQALAVIKNTGQESAARQFAAFLNTPAGQEIMQKYGFSK